MNCRQCDTWNPDDRNFCWRCGAELPKPVETKKKKAVTIGGLPIWMWLVIVLFFGALLLGQCFMSNLPLPA